jgi:hypothetical protein
LLYDGCNKVNTDRKRPIHKVSNQSGITQPAVR